ncbi:hypothetical protein K2Q08_02055 [Patescibacteria group bacterium]|nr:hypothetical protein [Patescibacteria group bacterium]
MTEKVKNEIIQCVGKIEEGIFTYQDIKILFINLRDSIPQEDPPNQKLAQIHDLFTFAAHPNSRERGKTFKVGKTIADQFVKSIQQGGQVTISVLEFAITEYIKEVLDILQIPYNHSSLVKQEHQLMMFVYEILDQVELELDNSAIEWAQIQPNSSTGQVYIAYKMKPFNNTIGSLTIRGNPTMRFRLL